MSDNVTPENRSWNMRQIHGKDTKIEVEVRKYLFSHGFRYRKNVASLPGKPDIVLPKYRTVVFVNGCFWHRHSGCKYCYTPKTNTEFWEKKFKKTVLNDRIVRDKLQALQWNVITVWECSLKRDKFEDTMQQLCANIVCRSTGE